MRNRGWLVRCVLAALCVLSVGSGCASSRATITPRSISESLQGRASFSRVALDVRGGSGVRATATDLDRIKAKVLTELQKQTGGKLKLAGVRGSPEDAAQTVRAELLLTRYDEGNAFARFMLAGLGQIHVEGKLLLKRDTDEKVLGEYDVTKTFAWGGLYGASTTIQDVEEGFVSGVVEAILGKSTS